MTDFVASKPITDDAIAAFCDKLEKFLNDGNAANLARTSPKLPSNFHDQTIGYEKGRKYVRVTQSRRNSSGLSVYCFLDFQGNIWKAAGWKAPALNQIRGHIDDPLIWKDGTIGLYGVAYLR
jgi:hypothetical protein